MAKAKKQPNTKSLTDFIVEQSKREHVYAFGESTRRGDIQFFNMLVGFQCPEQKVKDLIDEGLVFVEKGMEFTEFTDIDYIGGIVPFYFSQSHASKNVSGWTDPDWALAQYEIQKHLDPADWNVISNAICYQMNSAAVANRIGTRMAEYASVLDAKAPYYKAIMCISAAILLCYKDRTVINLNTIRHAIGERINAFSQWYFSVREEWLKGDKYHMVKRMDAFFDGKVYLEWYRKTNRQGEVKYDEFRKAAEYKRIHDYGEAVKQMMKCAKANYDNHIINEGLAG